MWTQCPGLRCFLGASACALSACRGVGGGSVTRLCDWKHCVWEMPQLPNAPRMGATKDRSRTCASWWCRFQGVRLMRLRQNQGSGRAGEGVCEHSVRTELTRYSDQSAALEVCYSKSNNPLNRLPPARQGSLRQDSCKDNTACCLPPPLFATASAAGAAGLLLLLLLPG